MSKTLIRRSDLESRLDQVTSGARSAESMREWLNELIVGDRVETAENDTALIMDVFYRLNSANDETEFVSLAQDTLAVLKSLPQNEASRAMLPLVWERDRIIEVLEHYEAGLVGDVHLRSFLNSGKWPTLAKKIQRLDSGSRAELLNALRSRDFDALPKLLGLVRTS
jgi:hypothetical protein